MKQAALFLLTIAIIFAAFVAGERTLSPSFQQCIAAPDKKNENDAAQKELSVFGATVGIYSDCTAEFLEGKSEIITAIATAIIAAFTFTLSRATSAQAKLTREALIADKRAFVFAKDIIYVPEGGSLPGFL